MTEPVSPIVGVHAPHFLLEGGAYHESLGHGAAGLEAHHPASHPPREVSGPVVWVAGPLDDHLGPRFAIAEHGEWLRVIVPEALGGPGTGSAAVHMGDVWTVVGVDVARPDGPTLVARALVPEATAPRPDGLGRRFDGLG